MEIKFVEVIMRKKKKTGNFCPPSFGPPTK